MYARADARSVCWRPPLLVLCITNPPFKHGIITYLYSSIVEKMKQESFLPLPHFFSNQKDPPPVKIPIQIQTHFFFFHLRKSPSCTPLPPLEMMITMITTTEEDSWFKTARRWGASSLGSTAIFSTTTKLLAAGVNVIDDENLFAEQAGFFFPIRVPLIADFDLFCWLLCLSMIFFRLERKIKIHSACCIWGRKGQEEIWWAELYVYTVLYTRVYEIFHDTAT